MPDKIIELPKPEGWQAIVIDAAEQIKKEGALTGVTSDGDINFRLVYLEPITGIGWDYCVCFHDGDAFPAAVTENIIIGEDVGEVQIFRRRPCDTAILN